MNPGFEGMDRLPGLAVFEKTPVAECRCPIQVVSASAARDEADLARDKERT